MLLEEADDQAAAQAAAAMANKNPLLGAILDACETLKGLQAAADEAAAAAAAASLSSLGTDNNGRQKSGAFSGEAIAGAKGLIFMRTDKIGFGVSVTQGYGLLVARNPSSSSSRRWSPPLPLKIEGCSLGAVVGYAEQRTLLALATDGEVREFCGGGGSGGGNGGGGGNDGAGGGNGAAKGKAAKSTGRRVKVGLDLNLGLGKRLNQSASVDAKGGGGKSGGGGKGGGDEGNGGNGSNGGRGSGSGGCGDGAALAATRAFTLSKGYIVDVSLKGLFVEPDADDLARAYGEGITAEDVLFGGRPGGGGGGGGEGGGGEGGSAGLVRAPPEAELLYRALQAAEDKWAEGGGKA